MRDAMHFLLMGLIWVSGLLLLVGLCAALPGCTAQPDAVCPVLVNYTAADDAALLAEIRAQPTPVTHRYLRDYAALRAQARVCAAGGGK